MSEHAETVRSKLKALLTRDPLLKRVFSSTGDLDRAKLSRARLLLKNATDNGVDLDLAIEAAVGIELVHLATLIHDDVIDDSELRRNEQSFRSAKGDKSAVLYGDYLFSAAVAQIQNTQEAGCAKVFVESIHQTCRGEALQDLLLTSEGFDPELENLFDVSRGKTGALFSFCTEAPAWMNVKVKDEIKNHLREIGYLLGLGYQLADDVLDIAGVEANLGKPAGNDLQKNTMTTPLYLMMKSQNKNWKEFREYYFGNGEKLKSEFLNSAQHEKLLSLIDEAEQKVNALVQACANEGWEINEIVQFFWNLYIKKRLELLKDIESKVC